MAPLEPEVDRGAVDGEPLSGRAGEEGRVKACQNLTRLFLQLLAHNDIPTCEKINRVRQVLTG
jgi:hypothetical protein